jgi:hypothetical protein
MPKHLDLKLLQPNLAAASNPYYFLFMLGTDTVFTPKPTKDKLNPLKRTSYENGETLSYVAQLVAHGLQETIEIDLRQPLTQPISFSTPSVDVLNGPGLYGTEVGERIAQGLFLVLKAVAEGKINIQIAAHSRGAVASILIVHELNRIKEELLKQRDQNTPVNAEMTLYSILQNTSCAYTKAAYKKFFSEIKESNELRNALATSLLSAQINMFLIDPVPGGGPKYMNVGWDDTRFHIKVPCNKIELLVCRDERTNWFTPLVPQEVKPISIPGHHGTASGNVYSQQLEDVVPTNIPNRDTSLVQKLVVYKLLYFINNVTNIVDSKHWSVPSLKYLAAITKPSVVEASVPSLEKSSSSSTLSETYTVALDHPELDLISTSFLKASKVEKSKQLLDLYKNLLLHDAAYRSYEKTSYSSVLGTHASNTGARYVHAGSSNRTSLDSIIPGLNGKFINIEHAYLFLHDTMNFSYDQDTDVVGLMSELKKSLLNLFRMYSEGNKEEIKALLDAKEDRLYTFQAISLFIDSISQRYLQTPLSVEVKTNLLKIIDETFSSIQGYKTQNPADKINDITSELEIILRKGVKITAETHYKSLLEQFYMLDTRLKYCSLSPEHFKLVFNEFLKALKNKVSDKEQGEKLGQIINQLKLNSSSIHEIVACYQQQFKECVNSKDELIIRSILQVIKDHFPGLDVFLNDYAEDTLNSELLIKINHLYETIDDLIEGNAHIIQLAGDFYLSIDFERLARCNDVIVKHLAQLLRTTSHKPMEISEKLFSIAKLRDISLVGKNPLTLQLEELQKEHDAILALNQQQSTMLAEFEVSQKEQAFSVCAQNKIRDDYQQQISQFELDRSQQRHVIAEQDDLISRLSSDKLRLEKSGQLFTQKTEQQESLIIQLEVTRVNQAQSLNELNDKLRTFNLDHAQLKRSIDNLTSEHEQKQLLIEQLRQEKSTRDETIERLTSIKKDHEALITQLRQEKIIREHTINDLEHGKELLQQSFNELSVENRRLDQSIEMLSQRSDVQQSLISQLEATNVRQDQAMNRLTDNLNQIELDKANLQRSMVDLTSHQEQRQLHIEQLQQEKLTHEQMIAKLNKTKKDQEIYIETLRVAQKKQEQVLVQTEKEKVALEQAMEVLNKSKEEQRTSINLLKEKKIQLKQKIDQLTLDKVTLQHENATLTTVATHQKQRIERLERNKKEQDEEIGGLNHLRKRTKEEKELLIEQLGTSNEISCANLIMEQLLPMTEKYSRHLFKQAKNINSSLKDQEVRLPVLAKDASETDKEAYNKIAKKYLLVQQLRTELTNTQINPLPSIRITKFASLIKQVNQSLKEHRDPDWKQFAKNCLIAIGIVCTLILPGIVALLAYSSYKGKSGPLFFTKSRGEEYSDSVESKLQHAAIFAGAF